MTQPEVKEKEAFDPNLVAISNGARKVINRLSDVLVGMDVIARRKLLAEFQLWTTERLAVLDKAIEEHERKDSLVVRPEAPLIVVPS